MDDVAPAPDSAPAAADASPNPAHVAFVRKREETFRTARATRRADLLERGPAIAKALEAYASLDQGDHPTIRIRREFVRLATARAEPDTDMPYRREDDLATRPPLTKLIHRSPNALPVLLTAIYVAHLENPSGKAVPNVRHNTFTLNGLVPWATLAGMTSSGPRDARHRRLRRALVELEKYELITTGPGTHRFTGWTLAAEDGSGRRYEVPGDSGPANATVRVPAWFFLRGWHLVLEPREIASLLMITDMTQSLPYVPSVGIPTKIRRNLYCLPDDTYSESIHELNDFGLIELHDPMGEHRVHGKLADREQSLQTYQMTAASHRPRHSGLYTRPALDVVLEDLTHVLPGRLYEDRMDPREWTLLRTLVAPQDGPRAAT